MDPEDAATEEDFVQDWNTPEGRAKLNEMIDEGLADIERGDTYTEEEARAYLNSLRAEW